MAVGFAAGCCVASCFASPAAAGDPAKAAPARDWTITLGAEGRVLPTYEGSDRSVPWLLPLINIRRAGTPRDFSSPRDNLSVAILESGKFHLGPTAKLRFPHRERDDTDLRGLGDVGWAFEAGLFAEYWMVDWLRTRVEVRQGFSGHRGIVADVSADLVVPVTKRLTLSSGPRVVMASRKALEPYFGITAAQSAASGYPVYSVSGGVQSYGAGVQARYEWDDRWASHIFMEYDRLSGNAAGSPIVVLRGSRNQFQFGIGVTYSFDVPGAW